MKIARPRKNNYFFLVEFCLLFSLRTELSLKVQSKIISLPPFIFAFILLCFAELEKTMQISYAHVFVCRRKGSLFIRHLLQYYLRGKGALCLFDYDEGFDYDESITNQTSEKSDFSLMTSNLQGFKEHPKNKVRGVLCVIM